MTVSFNVIERVRQQVAPLTLDVNVTVSLTLKICYGSPPLSTKTEPEIGFSTQRSPHKNCMLYNMVFLQ